MWLLVIVLHAIWFFEVPGTLFMCWCFDVSSLYLWVWLCVMFEACGFGFNDGVCVWIVSELCGFSLGTVVLGGFGGGFWLLVLFWWRALVSSVVAVLWFGVSGLPVLGVFVCCAWVVVLWFCWCFVLLWLWHWFSVVFGLVVWCFLRLRVLVLCLWVQLNFWFLV